MWIVGLEGMELGYEHIIAASIKMASGYQNDAGSIHHWLIFGIQTSQIKQSQLKMRDAKGTNNSR